MGKSIPSRFYPFVPLTFMHFGKAIGFVTVFFMANIARSQGGDSTLFSKSKSKAFNPIDTLRYYVNKRNGRFLLSLDGKNAYINGVSSPVVGFRFGLSYDKVALYSGLYSSNYFSRTQKDTTSINFGYVATTIEYYLADNWRYDVFVPISIGIGSKTIEKTEILSGNKKNTSEVFVPVEIGIGGTVRFLRYLGMAGSLGYRWSLYQGSDYSSPYWSLGFTLYTGTLWRDTKEVYRRINR